MANERVGLGRFWIGSIGLWVCWGTNFQVLISLAHSQKIPTWAHTLFYAHINISHTLFKYSPWYWAPTNFSYIKPHKLPWVLSQILPVISHISSNLNSPQINSPHITTKIGPQNYIIPTQGPPLFSLWAKPKKSPNSLKSHYDVANSKPATMWHYLLSMLLHGISKGRYDQASLKARYDPAPLKARCYMAPFTKPVATRKYFTKSQNHFS